MAVRNIRPGIGSTRPIPIHSPIPPSFSPIYKIELVDSDEVAYNVTDLIETGEYSDGVTDNIGSFRFKILDPNQTYSNVINNFDNIKIYLDYGTTATTLRFKGIVEKKSREEIYFNISGRSIGMTITGKNIIYSATDKIRSDVIKEMLELNFPEIDVSNIETDSTEVTVNYSEVSFQSIIEELCGKHHDFYIDANLKAYYFTKGSIQNSTEAVVQDYNHVSTAEYGEDSEDTITKVRVYGKKIGDIALFATSSSSTTHTNGVIKEKKISDNSILTTEQATERANFEYSSRISIPSIGEVTSMLLPSLAPGEKLFMGVPVDKIDPGYYVINSFTHSFPDLETKLTIQQRRLDIPKLIKSNINSTEGVAEKDNPYDLDFSRIITFEVNSGVHSNTEINEGRLKVKTGQSTGQWISDNYSLSSDVEKIAFKMTGENLVRQYGATTSNLWFSFDGGTTWTILRYGADYEVPSGTDLKIRIDLNNSDAQVEAIAFMYKLK